MKKTIYLFISIIVIFATVTFADLNEKATVNVTAVRIREKQTVESDVITNAYKNDEVEILEENGEWCKIQYNNKVGYVKTEFLTKKETSAIKPNTANENNMVSNTVISEEVTNTVPENNTINETISSEVQDPVIQEDVTVGDNILLQSPLKIRMIPSIACSEKQEIDQGTNIIILTQLGNWYKITDGGNISGWITSSKLNSLSTIQTPIPQPVEDTNTVEPEEDNTVSDNEPEEVEIPEKPEETVVEESKDDKESNNSTTQTSSANRKGKVIVETARVRKSASTTSEMVGTLDEDDIVTIMGEEGDFYKITTQSINGYVSKTLIKETSVTSRSMNSEREMPKEIEEIETTEEISAVEPENVEEENSSEVQNNLNSGNEVIEFAKQYLGYPYVLGCSTPENGFDCSGFTRYVFGHFGYTLGRTAADQTSLGEVVERANLQTGDLILFYNDAKTRIGHCAIYIGSGDFIHSANPQRGVVIDNINTNSYYNTRFVTARRIVQ